MVVLGRCLFGRLCSILLVVSVAACGSREITIPPPPAQLVDESKEWAIIVTAADDVNDVPAPKDRRGGAKAGAAKAAKGSVAAGSAVAAVLLGGAGESAGQGDSLAGVAAGAMVVVAGAAFVVGVVLAPVSAAVGAGIGAGKAEPDAAARAARARLVRAVTEADLANDFRERIVMVAGDEVGRTVLDCREPTTPTACIAAAPAPIGHVLSLQVGAPYFEFKDGDEPTTALFLAVEASVYTPGDADQGYERAWVFRGQDHDYFELAADQAALFRQELDTAVGRLSAKIVNDLLIGGGLEAHPRRDQPAGTVWTVSPSH